MDQFAPGTTTTPDTNAIRDFLSGVVPWPSADEEGFITIHWKYPGRKGFPGKAFRTVEEALAKVIRLRDKGCDIYFGLFRTRLSDGTRDRANATVTGSLFADVDIDPNDPRAFSSLPEAIDSILAFCIELKIPKPSLIVFSGGGLHVYWLSDRILTVEAWQPFADALMNAIRSAGLKIKDVGLTGDAARVLRVPGTSNYKYEPPRPVKVMGKYSTLEQHDFGTAFAPLLELAPVGPPARRQPSLKQLLGPVPEAFKHLPVRSLGAGIETLSFVPFPPIKEGCAWLREAHDTGGKDFDNPQWNLTTLCAVFLENGHELAHEFGDQHPGYVFEKTETEWDRKNREHDIKGLGWPSCKAIQAAGSKHCETCPHFAARGSPLHLGLPKPEPADPTADGPTAEPSALILTLADWEARDLPAPDYILGNVLATTTRLLFAADTGIGKTLFSLAMGMRCAHGCGFLHWAGIRPARVLYIDGEMSNRQLKQRLAEETARMGVRPETFFALSREDIPNMQPLNTHAGQMTIEAIIREHCGGRIDLLQADNIMALISGNHSEEEGWAKTMPWILDLTRRAIGQMWIHHTGHDTSRQYGTKTREWQMDAYAQADKVVREDADVSFLLSFRKARERTPGNRPDFADARITLVDNGWIHEDASVVKKMKLSPEGQKYFETLRELAGLPGTNGIFKFVRLESWRQACVKRGLIEGVSRTLFNKYKRELLTRNWIACTEDAARILP